MADNFGVLDSTGGTRTVAAKDISSVHYLRKLATWLKGAAAADTSHTDPLPTGARSVLGSVVDTDGTVRAVLRGYYAPAASGVNVLVAADASNKICVLGYSLQAADGNASAVAARFQDTSAVQLSQTWDLAAREGVALRPTPLVEFETPAINRGVNLFLSAALPVRVTLVYVLRP